MGTGAAPILEPDEIAAHGALVALAGLCAERCRPRDQLTFIDTCSRGWADPVPDGTGTEGSLASATGHGCRRILIEAAADGLVGPAFLRLQRAVIRGQGGYRLPAGLILDLCREAGWLLPNLLLRPAPAEAAMRLSAHNDGGPAAKPVLFAHLGEIAAVAPRLPDGPVLVLMPGTAAPAEEWEDLAWSLQAVLRRRRDCVILDATGAVDARPAPPGLAGPLASLEVDGRRLVVHGTPGIAPAVIDLCRRLGWSVPEDIRSPGDAVPGLPVHRSLAAPFRATGLVAMGGADRWIHHQVVTFVSTGPGLQGRLIPQGEFLIPHPTQAGGLDPGDPSHWSGFPWAPDGVGLVLTVAGPIGLAGSGRSRRRCEIRSGGVATPDDLEQAGLPGREHIAAATILAQTLTGRLGFQLDGSPTPPRRLRLCEGALDAVWIQLGVPRERVMDERIRARCIALRGLGVEPPMLDGGDGDLERLDAGLGAVLGHAWIMGWTLGLGAPPRQASPGGVWREGLARMLDPGQSSSWHPPARRLQETGCSWLAEGVSETGSGMVPGGEAMAAVIAP